MLCITTTVSIGYEHNNPKFHEHVAIHEIYEVQTLKNRAKMQKRAWLVVRHILDRMMNR